MRQANDSSFTLVEVLAASFILVLVLAIFIGLFHEGLKTTAASTGEEEALALAQAKLEELLGKPYSELLRPQELGSVGRYTYVIEVKDEEKSPEVEPLLRVEVSVSWREESKEKELSLVTLVADKGG